VALFFGRDAIELLEIRGNPHPSWQPANLQVEVSSGKLLKSFPHEVHVNYASMRD
jgi:hypothetical protein